MANHAAFVAILFKKDGELNIKLIRAERSGQLKLPGGKKQKEETPIETLKREVWEEVNLILKEEEIIKFSSQLRKDHTFFVFTYFLDSDKGDFFRNAKKREEEVEDFPISYLKINIENLTFASAIQKEVISEIVFSL